MKVARRSYIKVGVITVGLDTLAQHRRKVKGNLKIMAFIGDVWYRTQIGIAEVVSTGGAVPGYEMYRRSCTLKVKIDRQYWDQFKHSTIIVSSTLMPGAKPYVFARISPEVLPSLATFHLESKLKEFLE